MKTLFVSFGPRWIFSKKLSQKFLRIILLIFTAQGYL